MLNILNQPWAQIFWVYFYISIYLLYIYILILGASFTNMRGKMWDEITYPFLSFNVCTVEV